jgi:hypothetical protein
MDAKKNCVTLHNDYARRNAIIHIIATQLSKKINDPLFAVVAEFAFAIVLSSQA